MPWRPISSAARSSGYANNHPVTRLYSIILLSSLLLGCSLHVADFPDEDSAPSGRPDLSHVRNAVPRAEPLSRYGNPKSYVVLGKRYQVMSSSKGFVERGIASWYGQKFHGRRTSSGETYDMYKMTAAHKGLPLPTYVQVTNLENGRHIIVKVNDRGPFHQNRIIDLSYAGASKLGVLARGTAMVEVRAIEPGQSAPAPTRLSRHPPRIYLQVGAFSNQMNAQRLSQRLDTLIRRAMRIQQTRNNGREFFRVQVGPLASVEIADAISMQLARQGVPDTHIVLD